MGGLVTFIQKLLSVPRKNGVITRFIIIIIIIIITFFFCFYCFFCFYFSSVFLPDRDVCCPSPFHINSNPKTFLV